MKDKSIGDFVEEAFSLADSYHDAMCKWNGDSDGPMDKAIEELSEGLGNLFKEAILQGYRNGGDNCLKILLESNKK